MINIQIKRRYSDAVIFECNAPEGMYGGLHMRHALEKAAGARANLAGAYLAGANLARAYLAGANLARANLDGAKLRDDALLVGAKPIIQIGPIGSRSGILVAYLTNDGLRLDAGCQRQITRAVFEQRLQDTHGDNEHAQEYRAALAFIDAHAAIWLPKEQP